jgi:hypothetical protein
MDTAKPIATNHKEGGALIYIMEELTDARLRCEQLKKFVSQAVRLIGQSSHRDHFYEVAGDTIYGIPDALFKLDKALAATALAASRLDYEELKAQLKPEKVEELEDVLRDTRIRQIDRRAPYIQPRPEQKTATALSIQDLNKIETSLEGIILEALKLRKDLPRDSRVDEIEEEAKEALKKLRRVSFTIASKQGKSHMFKAASTSHVAGALRRIAADVEAARISPKEASRRLSMVRMALSQTAQEAVQAMGDIQATTRQDVIDGFKKSNPALSKEQLEEIADHWEENKDVVKDKHQ